MNNKRILLSEEDNKVLISGSQMVATSIFHINPWINLPTYNQSLGLDTGKNETRKPFLQIPPYTYRAENGSSVSEKQKNEVWLYCCGIDGCGAENSQVYDVDYTQRIRPSKLIPFRYRTNGGSGDLEGDIGEINRDDLLKYVGKKTETVVNGSANVKHYYYYFKTFESNTTVSNCGTGHARFEDGTVINGETLYKETEADEIGKKAYENDAELFVELNLQITKTDFREYFSVHKDIGSLINTISLCSAWREMGADGIIRYHDITPVTKLNIPNESLIDLSKGIDITYQVYF